MAKDFLSRNADAIQSGDVGYAKENTLRARQEAEANLYRYFSQLNELENIKDLSQRQYAFQKLKQESGDIMKRIGNVYDVDGFADSWRQESLKDLRSQFGNNIPEDLIASIDRTVQVAKQNNVLLERSQLEDDARDFNLALSSEVRAKIKNDNVAGAYAGIKELENAIDVQVTGGLLTEEQGKSYKDGFKSTYASQFYGRTIAQVNELWQQGEFKEAKEYYDKMTKKFKDDGYFDHLNPQSKSEVYRMEKFMYTNMDNKSAEIALTMKNLEQTLSSGGDLNRAGRSLDKTINLYKQVNSSKFTTPRDRQANDIAVKGLKGMKMVVDHYNNKLKSGNYMNVYKPLNPEEITNMARGDLALEAGISTGVSAMFQGIKSKNPIDRIRAMKSKFAYNQAGVSAIGESGLPVSGSEGSKENIGKVMDEQVQNRDRSSESIVKGNVGVFVPLELSGQFRGEVASLNEALRISQQSGLPPTLGVNDEKFLKKAVTDNVFRTQNPDLVASLEENPILGRYLKDMLAERSYTEGQGAGVSDIILENADIFSLNKPEKYHQMQRLIENPKTVESKAFQNISTYLINSHGSELSELSEKYGTGADTDDIKTAVAIGLMSYSTDPNIKNKLSISDMASLSYKEMDTYSDYFKESFKKMNDKFREVGYGVFIKKSAMQASDEFYDFVTDINKRDNVISRLGQWFPRAGRRLLGLGTLDNKEKFKVGSVLQEKTGDRRVNFENFQLVPSGDGKSLNLMVYNDVMGASVPLRGKDSKAPLSIDMTSDAFSILKERVEERERAKVEIPKKSLRDSGGSLLQGTKQVESKVVDMKNYWFDTDIMVDLINLAE